MKRAIFLAALLLFPLMGAQASNYVHVDTYQEKYYSEGKVVVNAWAVHARGGAFTNQLIQLTVTPPPSNDEALKQGVPSNSDFNIHYDHLDVGRHIVSIQAQSGSQRGSFQFAVLVTPNPDDYNSAMDSKSGGGAVFKFSPRNPSNQTWFDIVVYTSSSRGIQELARERTWNATRVDVPNLPIPVNVDVIDSKGLRNTDNDGNPYTWYTAYKKTQNYEDDVKGMWFAIGFAVAGLVLVGVGVLRARE